MSSARASSRSPWPAQTSSTPCPACSRARHVGLPAAARRGLVSPGVSRQEVDPGSGPRLQPTPTVGTARSTRAGTSRCAQPSSSLELSQLSTIIAFASTRERPPSIPATVTRGACRSTCFATCSTSDSNRAPVGRSATDHRRAHEHEPGADRALPRLARRPDAQRQGRGSNVRPRMRCVSLMLPCVSLHSNVAANEVLAEVV